MQILMRSDPSISREIEVGGDIAQALRAFGLIGRNRKIAGHHRDVKTDPVEEVPNLGNLIRRAVDADD